MTSKTDENRKRELIAQLQARLEALVAGLTASQKSVQEGAVHPEARQEDSKDTRAIEAGYLARGLAERVETLRDGIRAIALMPARSFGLDDVAAPGAIVTVADDDGAETRYLLAPAGGGEVLRMEGRDILVLTPRSPLGAAVAGTRCGDTIEAELPSGRMRAEIVGIE